MSLRVIAPWQHSYVCRYWSGDEPFATLCKIWPVRDLNSRPFARGTRVNRLAIEAVKIISILVFIYIALAFFKTQRRPIENQRNRVNHTCTHIHRIKGGSPLANFRSKSRHYGLMCIICTCAIIAYDFWIQNINQGYATARQLWPWKKENTMSQSVNDKWLSEVQFSTEVSVTQSWSKIHTTLAPT